MADTVDPHELYQLAVQGVDFELDFVEQTFKDLRGRRQIDPRGLLRYGTVRLRVGPPPPR